MRRLAGHTQPTSQGEQRGRQAHNNHICLPAGRTHEPAAQSPCERLALRRSQAADSVCCERRRRTALLRWERLHVRVGEGRSTVTAVRRKADGEAAGLSGERDGIRDGGQLHDVGSNPNWRPLDS